MNASWSGWVLAPALLEILSGGCKPPFLTMRLQDALQITSKLISVSHRHAASAAIDSPTDSAVRLVEDVLEIDEHF